MYLPGGFHVALLEVGGEAVHILVVRGRMASVFRAEELLYQM